MIVLNDFIKQWALIKESTLNSVNRVGESGWLILGKEVEKFEQSIAQMLEVKYAIGCGNGLDALEISLRTLGIKPEDKVLTTPLSAFASTLAILKIGAIPVFVDVDELGLIDLNQCEYALQKDSAIKFLLPVHLYGHPVNLRDLAVLKQKYSIKIVEDCAQAILARSSGQLVGQVGEMSAISLYPTKNLGCLGDGGVIITQSESLAKMARALRDYGQTEKYVHEFVGLNSRLDELHAAILNESLLPHLIQHTNRRVEIAKRYLCEIKNPNMQLPVLNETAQSVWHLFPILIQGSQDQFRKHMLNNNIQTGIHYPILITDQKALTPMLTSMLTSTSATAEILTELKNARNFANQQISLPIHPFLTEEEINEVIEACNQWSH